MTDGISRRNQLDKFTPTERAIWDAAAAVEAMPPDVRLTHAGIKLTEARALVADYIDGVPFGEGYPHTINMPIDPRVTGAQPFPMTAGVVLSTPPSRAGEEK